MGKKVAVIGGGYAGIAAAFSLSESGIPLTLFEMSKTLGGRARGLEFKGARIDNGQHILLGCYTETLALIGKTCPVMDPFLRIPLELSVDGFRLKARPLPPPFDLLSGLVLCKGLSFAERLSAAKFLSKARKMKLESDISVSELLELHGQGGNLADFLWKPLCLSALNTPIEEASSRVFLAVLEEGLDGKGSDIVIPSVDLSTLFPLGAAKIIERRGGEILTSKPVRSIRKNREGFEIATDRETLSFSHVVCAVAPQHLPGLIAELPEIEAVQFDYQPICTVYSQYPGNIRLPGKMTGSSRGIVQWRFDRGGGLIAAVASAKGEHLAISRAELASRVHEETARMLPGLPPPIWQKVITEKRATFSCAVDLCRPEQKTPLPGFYLAGDYTAGRYPATLEAAVRSGIACARHIGGSWPHSSSLNGRAL